MKKTLLASLAVLSLALLGCSQLPVSPAKEVAKQANPTSFFSVSVNSIPNHSVVKTLPLTLKGTVSTAAQVVSVNDIALPDYIAGSGKWSYQIDKMEEGENIYKITAQGENNASITTTFALAYQPE